MIARRQLLGFLLALGCLHLSAAQYVRGISGVWLYTSRDKKISERYEFRSDGTGKLTSCKETVQVKYKLSIPERRPDMEALDLAVMATNGGRDCSGQAHAVGFQTTLFIGLDNSGTTFVECNNPVDDCDGSARRVD